MSTMFYDPKSVKMFINGKEITGFADSCEIKVDPPPHKIEMPYGCSRSATIGLRLLKPTPYKLQKFIRKLWFKQSSIRVGKLRRKLRNRERKA